MEWADVGRAVAKSAPVLGSVLGGPVGAIAGAAGSLIASALGCEPDPEAVQRTIAQSPDLLLKLKDLEIQQQAQLLQWQRDQVQAELTDRMSARDREVELAKSGHGATWATSIVACIVTVGFFCHALGGAPRRASRARRCRADAPRHAGVGLRSRGAVLPRIQSRIGVKRRIPEKDTGRRP